MNHTAQKVSQMCHKSMGRGFGFPMVFSYVYILIASEKIIILIWAYEIIIHSSYSDHNLDKSGSS